MARNGDGQDNSGFSKKDDASAEGPTPDPDDDDNDPNGKKKNADAYTVHGRQRAEEAKNDPHRSVVEKVELFAKGAHSETQKQEIL
ncbi:hypothetical protein G8E10_24535 [Rhizobiaceae bacterium CRRU44]|uniref:Uncharacterized protein n=1 Tax=Ferranicluibacter rubi TaxID=2715133 RepID=A0AA43ZJM1_9HYPH|nr:hypothetical protein [Ferranicluibacter rubi]NHT78869.1 hypothetical protein [Ferranicluibacter rubi]